MSAILGLSGDQKFDGLVGFKAIFWMDMFKMVAFEMGDIMEDSNGNLLQIIGTVVNACKIELA